MSNFQSSGPVGGSAFRGRNPFSFATKAQYTRYLQCLQRENIPSTPGGSFTDAQLRCAIQTIGCPPGYSSKCSTLSVNSGYDTPVINPAPGIRPSNDISSTTVDVNGTKLKSAGSSGDLKWNGSRYVSTYGNNSGFGQPEMTGYAFMPTNFRDVSKPVITPERYGITDINGGLPPGRFVSATHQRITGGDIVPLEKPLQSVSRNRTRLQSVNLTDESWSENLKNLQNLNQTTKVFQSPPRISGKINVDGQVINNLGSSSPWSNTDLDTTVFTGEDGTTGTPGATGTGVNQTAQTALGNVTPRTGDDASGTTVYNPDGTIASPGVPVYNENYAPFDSENIRYNQQPLIDLTPLEVDSNGNYVPAGPTARTTVSSPTPEATITQEDMIGIEPGTELFINGKRIILRSPDICDIKTQVNCADMGVRADTGRSCNEGVDNSAGNGITDSLVLSSCDGSPFTIANGCGGGTYKQVGDFHVSRGFDQQRNKSVTSNAVVINRQLSSYTDADGNEVQNPFEFIGLDGEVKDLNRDIPYAAPNYTRYFPTKNGDRATMLMDNETETTTYSTGGSGYRVGDRLRIIGGTPVNNARAPLTKICIESAGSGYINPANLQVIINQDGQATGIGASASVVELDENGGIASIQMNNYGAGYDISKPPTITIYDSSPTITSYETVSTMWTADFNTNANVQLNANDIVKIEDAEIVRDEVNNSSSTIVTNRFYIATAPVTLGNINVVDERLANVSASNNDVTVAYVDPTDNDLYLNNRIEITTEQTGIADLGVRHNSYAQVTHFPATQIYSVGLEITDDNVSGFKIEDNTTLFNAMEAATAQWGTGVDLQVAIYREVSGEFQLEGFTGYGNHVQAGGNISLGNYYSVDSSSYTPSTGDTIYVGVGATTKYLIPRPADPNDNVVTDTKFVLESSTFTSADQVSVLFPAETDIMISVTENWWKDILNSTDRPKLVQTIDPRTPKNDPVLTAKIGIDPNPDSNSNNIFADGYEALNGPLRVAKFIVTGVDANGTITQLRIIDRGLYTIFPSDLTYGLPLEYDYVTDGSITVPDLGTSSDITTESQRRRLLGVVDPTRRNAEYGTADHDHLSKIFPSVDEVVYKMNQSGVTTFNGVAITQAIKDEINRVLGKRAQGQTLTADEQTTLNSFQTLINEYYTTTGVTAFKHPDWSQYKEYYFDGTKFKEYTGSPGGYDPSTYVIIDSTYGNDPNRAFSYGTLLRKDKLIDLSLSPVDPEFGRYVGSLSTGDTIVAGGTGGRVFLTAQDVPNCLERGRAKEDLGLPDEVSEVNSPNSLARALNNALNGAGYAPEDISFRVREIGDIGVIELDSDFPGLKIDSPTPGLLEKLGIPRGDYNLGMLCIEATLEDPTLTADQANTAIDGLISTGNFGLLDANTASNITGVSRQVKNPTSILSLLCVDRLGTESSPDGPGRPDSTGTNNTGNNGLDTDPDSLSGYPGYGSGYPVGGYSGNYPLNDNNSIFNDGTSSGLTELFKYDITNIYGENVILNGNNKQSTEVCVFESKRFNENNVIDGKTTFDLVTDNQPVTSFGINAEANAWVDNYEGGGWAYLENGIVRRTQQPLVDVEYISDALIYDSETGDKSSQLAFWDPFKGILPGFIRNEIHHISEVDPVSYQNSRSVFGRNSIGKVWWDTSTVRYQWYEQGSNEERRDNWGRAFPGSSITVCEWVESKSLPENWNGNGTPRWRDRYVTERHQDPVSKDYELYYYYWVQNRTLVDDRVTRDLGRTLDTQTIAKYIANPVGYGLEMISFVNNDAFMISNAAQAMDTEETNLQVNFSRNLNPDGLKHTAWKLMREGDSTSDVPEHLTEKLIDSLCGFNTLVQQVPDARLSEVEKYGIAFRPRQSMFKNSRNARRVMVSVLNGMLAGLKLNTQYPEWDSELPADRNFHSVTNWFAPLRTDPVTNEVIRYDSSYKPVFNVNSVAELYKLGDIPDGTVVQVKATQNSTSELWLYNASDSDYVQIAIANETIKLNDNLFELTDSPLMATELRALLVALNTKVFINNELWNTFFFEMLKHAYVEQSQLSWAFKTSYLYIEKEEDDLIKFTGFKPDNFQKVLDYMNEVKPFNAKIREYKDRKRTPMDIIGQNNLSDFDKPPYVDPVTGEVRILDESNEDDFALMSNDAAYVDYITVTDKSQDPIRRSNTTLTFDRTNWRLTQRDWNPVTTPINLSIAQNIANLVQLSNLEVQSNIDVRAADRIFKYDTAVQECFDTEVNTYYNDANASSNTSIVHNATAIYNIIEAGQLKNTLELVKDKVGGNFVGESLDAKEFNTIKDDINYVNEIISEFGFDTDVWDENTDNDIVQFSDVRDVANYGNVTTIGVGDIAWDSTKQLVNYEGVFNTATQGAVTLRRNDESYEGFDGVTFQRVLYGEERPEELVLLDPLESLILTVTTTPYANGDSANANVDLGTAIDNGATVTYRTHRNLFGGVDYLRITGADTTAISSNVFTYSTEIVVDSATILPMPSNDQPGKVWIGDELVYFGRRIGNVLSNLTRGAMGTSIQNHPAGTEVYSAESDRLFNDRSPSANIWLDTGIEYTDPALWDHAIQLTGAGTPNIASDDSWNVQVTWDEIVSGNVTTITTTGIVANSSTVTGNLTVVSNANITVNEGIKVQSDNNTAITLSANSDANVETFTTQFTVSDIGNVTLDQEVFDGNVKLGSVASIDANSNTVTINELVSNTIISGTTLALVYTDYVKVTAVNSNVISIISGTGTADLDTTNIFVANANITVESIEYGEQSPEDYWDGSASTLETRAQSLSDRIYADFTVDDSIMRFLHNL